MGFLVTLKRKQKQKDYFLGVSSGTLSGVLSGELSGELSGVRILLRVFVLLRLWTGRLSSYAIMRCYTI